MLKKLDAHHNRIKYARHFRSGNRRLPNFGLFGVSTSGGRQFVRHNLILTGERVYLTRDFDICSTRALFKKCLFWTDGEARGEHVLKKVNLRWFAPSRYSSGRF